MSAIEQVPNGPALSATPREPPPVVFAEAAAKAARPVAPRPVDRKPLSQAAARRRTSWIRRACALVVLLAVIAGVAIAIQDSKITLHSKAHAAPRPSSLLSANQLGLQRHRRHRHHGAH